VLMLLLLIQKPGHTAKPVFVFALMHINRPPEC
jgi:hypothetical protein